MAALGDAFFFSVDRSHLWVVISTPQGPRGEFVMVNFTTLDEKVFDESCILEPEDYPEYIDRPTVVYYIDARLWWHPHAKGYDALNADGVIIPMPRVRAATLRRIQLGALDSDFFPPDYQPLVQASLVPLPPPPRAA